MRLPPASSVSTSRRPKVSTHHTEACALSSPAVAKRVYLEDEENRSGMAKISVAIDARRAMRGGHLRRVHIEMVMTDDWFVDADTLSRLRKFRREGLVISIVNAMNHLDLLDSYNQPVIRDG